MPRKPAQPKNESPAELPPRTDVVVYENGADVRIEVTTDGETIWMTQALLAELFQVDRSVVAKHVRNIYATGELDKRSTCAKGDIRQVQAGVNYLVQQLTSPPPAPPRRKIGFTQALRRQSSPCTTQSPQTFTPSPLRAGAANAAARRGRDIPLRRRSRHFGRVAAT